MPQKHIAFLESDNVVRVKDLQNKGSGSYLNAASVVLKELKDSAGAAVPGFSDTTMDYVASSNGNYTGVLQDTLPLADNAEYTAKVVAIGDGLQKTWLLTIVTRFDDS